MKSQEESDEERLMRRGEGRISSSAVSNIHKGMSVWALSPFEEREGFFSLPRLIWMQL